MKKFVAFILSLSILTLTAFNGNADILSEDTFMNYMNGSTPYEKCGNDNCENLTSEKPQEDISFLRADAIIKYYSLQEISTFLNLDLETEFDAFIFVNTDKNRNQTPREPFFIPSQFGRIIWKAPESKNKLIFTRDEKNRITGLIPESFQIIPNLDDSFLDAETHLNPEVLAYLAQNPGLNFFPVATGTEGNKTKTTTLSGIFGVDFQYTYGYRNRRYENTPLEHMPYTILADAQYGNYRNLPMKTYEGSPEKFPFGIHGTPEYMVSFRIETNGKVYSPMCPDKIYYPKFTVLNNKEIGVALTNEDPAELPNGFSRLDNDTHTMIVNEACINRHNEATLGLKRDSAGCIRTYNPTSKVIFNWAMSNLLSNDVPKLNPSKNLPDPGLPAKRGKNLKLLIIPFDGYVSKGTVEI